MKTASGALIASIIAFLLLPAAQISAGGGAAFGLRPAHGGGDFTYALQPGESVSGEVLVSNSGQATGTAKIYAVDAHTGARGGVTFPGGEGSQNSYAGAWVTLSQSRVTLEPAEEAAIAFTFAVPADAEPGEYAAGILVEDTERATGDLATGPLVVQVVSRAAVAILATVPGPVTYGFEITSAEFSPGSLGQAGFVVGLRNKSNVHIKPVTAKLEVLDASEKVIGSLPIEITRRFLARDTLNYRAQFKQALPPGQYWVVVTLDWGGDPPAVWKSPFEVVGEAVENPGGRSEARLDLPGGSACEQGSPQSVTGPNYWMYATIGLGLLIIPAIAVLGGVLVSGTGQGAGAKEGQPKATT